MEAHAKAWETDWVLGGWREASGLGLAKGHESSLLTWAQKKLGLLEQMESSEEFGYKAWPCVPWAPKGIKPHGHY